MATIPDLTNLEQDIQQTKVEALTILTNAIDGMFGVGAKEIAPLAGHVKDFIVNFLEANLSGPAGAFLSMVLGISAPAIKSAVDSATVAIGTELQVFQHKVDAILASVA